MKKTGPRDGWSEEFYTDDGKLRVSVCVKDDDHSFHVEIFAGRIGGNLKIVKQGDGPNHCYILGIVETTPVPQLKGHETPEIPIRTDSSVPLDVAILETSDGTIVGKIVGIGGATEQQVAELAYPNHSPEAALANHRAGKEIWDTNGDAW